MFLKIFFYIFLASSADHSKYRTCEQSKFCSRDRFVSQQNWKLVPSSIKVKKNNFEAHIDDQLYNTKLSLKIHFLECGSARIRIEPSSKESFPRYDASEDPAIVSLAEVASLVEIDHQKAKDKSVLKPTVDPNQVLEIQYDPFVITVFEKDGKKRRLTLNADNTAVFETGRDKEKNPELFESSNWGGHNDQFKNGPTSVALDIDFNSPNVRLSGLPSHTLPLSLQNTVNVTDPIRLFNTDINTFEVNSVMSMYGAIPFVFSHSSDGNFDGIFWNNPSETWADVSNIAESENSKRLRLMSEGGFIDLYVTAGSQNPTQISEAFTRITGKPQLIPYFGLGFHQCRWGYLTDKEVLEVDKNLDDAITPHDVLWLDLDHTDNQKYFTFHPSNFKDPLKLLAELDKNKRQLVVLNDPHLRAEDSYKVYSEAKSKKLLIKNSDGNGEFVGNCWPGRSVWPDFMIPEAREWWASNFHYSKFTASRPNLFIWNDMNEIAVFDSCDLTAPRDLVHHNNIEEREVHNVYGLLMVSATFDGLLKRNKDMNQRPFILTRSFYAGTQKYALMWTGDNTGDWLHLRNSLQMVLCDGLCGMVYTGADVGGFFNSPDQNLLSRWYQVGAWTYPFFRVHCHHLSNRREINTLNGDFFNAAHDAILERYQLLPFWYTLSRHSNLTGAPIVRPVWWHFSDESFIDTDDVILIGDSLFVTPFLDEEGKDMKINLPLALRGKAASEKIRWFDFRSLKEINSAETVVHFNGGRTPVFIRGGSIVPSKSRIRKSSTLMFWDPFKLTIALDSNEKAEGELYVDDGESFDFARTNGYVHKRITFQISTDSNEQKIGKLSATDMQAQTEGSAFAKDYDVVIEQVKIAGLKKQPKSIFIPKSESENYELSFDYDSESGILTVHRTQLPVRDNFEIQFIF